MDTKKLPVGLPVFVNSKPGVICENIEPNRCGVKRSNDEVEYYNVSSIKPAYPTTADYFKSVMMAEGWGSPYRYTSLNKGEYGKRLGIFIEKYEVRTAFEATKLWSDIDLERVKEFQQALAHATALKAIREYETQNK